MSELKMSEFFKLPVNELIKELSAGKTIPINCDGVSEFQAIDLAVSYYDANQELIKKYESILCDTCGGAGFIGSPPDNFEDCPKCVAPIQKLSDDNYKKSLLIERQKADIQLLREALKEITLRSDTLVSAASVANCALESTNPDKE